jgi:hypothetical protein
MSDWKSTAQGLAFVAAPLVVAGAAVAVAHFGKTAASNPLSKKIRAELAKYARETAADMGESYAAAVRAMRDEPGQVAGDLGIDADDVIEWCRQKS